MAFAGGVRCSPCRSLAHARSLSRVGFRAVASRRWSRRFCQLVLAACKAMIAVCRGYGGDGIACRFFSFLVSGGRGDGVSSRPLVSSLVSCWRPVLRLVSASCFSHHLVSRPVSGFRFSCRRWRFVSRFVPLSRVGVQCCRAFRVGVVLLRRFCQLVFSCRLVFSRRCRCFFVCLSRRACRVASGRRERCNAAVRGRRGAGGVACRYAMRVGGRFGDAVSCGVVCRERDEGRDAWRDEGRDGGCAVFVSSIWRFVGRWRCRGWMRAGVCREHGWCHPHVSSFSCLSYRIRRMRLRLLVSFLCLVLASCLFRLGVRLVGMSRFFVL